MWQNCAVSRNEHGLKLAITSIQKLKQEFWENLKVSGKNNEINLELEKALRLADFLELSELMCQDALSREESCGAHFREEYQTKTGEALRNDKGYSYVSAWKYKDQSFELLKEPLKFESIELTNRSYE